MTALNKMHVYRGYILYVELSNGYFFAFDDESATPTLGAQVASENTLPGLQAKLDALEANTKRDRIRPEFPVVNDKGEEGRVKGMHAGTRRPNVKMKSNRGDFHSLYFDIPLVRQLIVTRRDLLHRAHELEVALNTDYRLPSLGQRATSDDLVQMEEDMRRKWLDLSSNIVGSMTYADVIDTFTTKQEVD